MTRTSSSEKQTRAGILTDRSLFSFHIANCNHSSIAQLFLPPLRGEFSFPARFIGPDLRSLFAALEKLDANRYTNLSRSLSPWAR